MHCCYHWSFPTCLYAAAAAVGRMPLCFITFWHVQYTVFCRYVSCHAAEIHISYIHSHGRDPLVVSLAFSAGQSLHRSAFWFCVLLAVPMEVSSFCVIWSLLSCLWLYGQSDICFPLRDLEVFRQSCLCAGSLTTLTVLNILLCYLILLFARCSSRMQWLVASSHMDFLAYCRLISYFKDKQLTCSL